jgi:hypothetical protein
MWVMIDEVKYKCANFDIIHMTFNQYFHVFEKLFVSFGRVFLVMFFRLSEMVPM